MSDLAYIVFCQNNTAVFRFDKEDKDDDEVDEEEDDDNEDDDHSIDDEEGDTDLSLFFAISQILSL